VAAAGQLENKAGAHRAAHHVNIRQIFMTEPVLKAAY
jgi:hypothetical protein